MRFLTFLTFFLAVLGGAAFAAEHIYTCKTGDFRISLLSEGQQQGKTDILIGAPAALLARCAPDGTFPNAVNAFLIQTPEKNILVDTGFGRNLFANLRALDVKPEQVDTVLLTHLHGDHIGGMIQDGKKAFPRAEIYVAQPEYKYWMRSGQESVKRTMELYRDKLHLFQPQKLRKITDMLIPGVYAVAAYGHTPGHTMFLVESKGERLLIWGDLTHAMAVQMPSPEISVTYDVNPAQAAAVRKKVLEYVAKEGIPIAGMHIAFPAMGWIRQGTGGGYMFKGM